MKKITAFALTATMILALCSCTGKDNDVSVRRPDKEKPTETTASVVTETDPAPETEATTTESSAETEATTTTEETTTATETTETSATETETTETTSAAPSSANAPSFIKYSVDTVSGSDTFFSGDAVYYGASYNADLISVDDDRFPELMSYLNDYNSRTIHDYEENLKTDYEESKKMADESEFYYIAREYSSVTMNRADSTVFSYTRCSGMYLGGAHDTYGYFGMNFDPITAKEITISDVCKDPDQLLSNVKDYLEANVERLNLFDEYKDYIKEYTGKDLNFVITAEGLTVFFNPYEVAPYAAGVIEVSVPYEDNTELLEGKYFSDVPSDRFYSFRCEYIDGLENYELLTEGTSYFVNASIMDYAYTDLCIMINDKPNTFNDFYAFTYEPYLVKYNGETYIYIQTTEDSDYSMVHVYKIDGNVATYVGYTAGWMSSPLNPEYFSIGKITQMIGTSSAIGMFKVGKDGMPELISECMRSTSSSAYVLIGDLEDGIVIKDGKETDEKFSFHKGDSVTVYGCNGDMTTVDLMASDGTRVRFEFGNGWPSTIGGKDLYSVFNEEDLFWAG